MKPIDLEELAGLRKECERLRQQADTASGALSQRLDDLEKLLGTRDPAKARERLAELKERHDRKSARYGRLMAKIKKGLENYDEQTE